MSFYEFILAMEMVVSSLFPEFFSTDKLNIMTKVVGELKTIICLTQEAP